MSLTEEQFARLVVNIHSKKLGILRSQDFNLVLRTLGYIGANGDVTPLGLEKIEEYRKEKYKE